MSRLYINDLERIKEGKIARFSISGNASSNSLVSLKRIDNQREEIIGIRNIIIDQFKKDTYNQLNKKDCQIKEEENVSLYNENLFINNNLMIKIPTALGYTNCILSKDGIVSSSSLSKDLDEKVKLILPYVNKLLILKEHINALDNELFEDIYILNNNQKAMYLNGSGVFLPFYDYTELSRKELDDLLTYYYTNHDDILQNILVNNDDKLNRFETNLPKEKVLELYKDI